MVQEQRQQLKMRFLLGYNMKNVIQWRNRLIVGEEVTERIFAGGGAKQVFSW